VGGGNVPWALCIRRVRSPSAITGGFGNSVALSGRTAVVGDPFKNANAGAAYVFVKV
jgi:hypothetical protein